jgi:hypothetical protein
MDREEQGPFHVLRKEGTTMADGKEIKFHRVSLYKEVWADPMSTVAKRYGVPYAGLKKICSKMNVPTPSSGFWTRKQLDMEVTIPPLPPVEPGEPEEFVFAPKKSPVEAEIGTEALRIIASKKDTRPMIEVAERLVKPHPLVSTTEAVLEAAKPDDKGLVFPREEGCLDVTVSPTHMNRALKIMDALIKALNAKGYEVSTKYEYWKCKTSVVILGERIDFGIREQYRRQEASADKYGWRQFSYHPSGQLSFAIKSWVARSKAEWSDGKRNRLEDLLQDILIGLIQAADVVRQWHLEREEENRQREEQRRRHAELERQRQKELERFQGLQREVRDYHEAGRIRAYVAAVRTTTIEQDGVIEPGGKLEKWMEWALAHADRLDPLVDSPPSILD